MNVTEKDRERAQQITGCKPYRARVENEWDFTYCTTHDEDGNPRWNECRWAPVAAALAEERRDALLDAAKRLDFTPLSERESGQVSDYTAGMHAAAKIVRLLAGESV